MKKLILVIALCLIPTFTFAGSLAETFDGLFIQGAATDPLTTALIADNFSHTVSLKDSKGKKYTWFNLNFNGAGTCIVRLMNTTTKANYPAIPVQADIGFSRVVNKNALYLNYSSCAGGTTTNAGTDNSVLELQ